MTRPARATTAEIKRAIRAAQDAGLRVVGIRPDGFVVTDPEYLPPLIPADEPADTTEDLEIR